ncbi:unnamed protein product [Rangifer tarandus platyrhynchus]|uniref:Uncharacterized protein n=1 Tax=Rangifer tarandus platyrhynchus TaxID=3082113 RepID=A0AC59Z2Z2_RANTA
MLGSLVHAHASGRVCLTLEEPLPCGRSCVSADHQQSVSLTGVVLAMRGTHTALGRGNQVDVVSRKSRGQTQHLRGHVSKLPVHLCGDRKWRLQQLRSSVFSVPCALLISPYGTCPQSSALRYPSPLTSVESPVPVLNSLLLRCV